MVSCGVVFFREQFSLVQHNEAIQNQAKCVQVYLAIILHNNTMDAAAVPYCQPFHTYTVYTDTSRYIVYTHIWLSFVTAK